VLRTGDEPVRGRPTQPRRAWPELSTLVTIMLLGHWLEMRSLGQAFPYAGAVF